MTNRPKAIGTNAESAVVKSARLRGFPNADRLTLTGAGDRGDVRLTTGLTAGVIVEVKGGQAAKTASDNLIDAWLAETERERVNAGAAVAFLVTQRPGIGPANAHRWWAHTTLYVLAELRGYPPLSYAGRDTVRLTLDSMLVQLRAAGYGDPLEREAPVLTCDVCQQPIDVDNVIWWEHARLGAKVHGTCPLTDVMGEDVTGHTMLFHAPKREATA